MSKWIIVALIILIVLICFYLMNKYKQQAVQVLTLESFLHASTLGEDAGKKKDIVEGFKDYDDGHDGDGGDHGDGDDGGH